MRRLPVVFGLVVGASLAAASSAQACMLDNKPSAYANGVRAVITKGAPTAATYAWWAHFAFPHSLRVGQRVVFREDDAQVRKALPSLLRHSPRPWRWRFGDGQSVVGDHPAHAYRRPGRYKVLVQVYGKGYGWQTFDSITATVRR